MEGGQDGVISLSTRALPPARRFGTLHEVFADVVRLDLSAPDPTGIEAEMTVHRAPDLRRTRMVSNLAGELARPASRLGDQDDSLCLILNEGGPFGVAQRGRESVAQAGEGVLLIYREPALLRFRDMSCVAVRVPLAGLHAAAADIGPLPALRIPATDPALRLLKTYLTGLPGAMADPGLLRLMSAHVCDLIALAIGARDEVRERAQQGGVRAARLGAIRAALAADPTLTLAAVAARQGISPRYVQMLFEEAGTSFSAHLLGLRLEAARAMLGSPRHEGWSIAAIAFEAGFGDVSSFNRQFRRRFGMAPSDMRPRRGGPPG